MLPGSIETWPRSAWFLRRHTAEEAAGYAADITRKLRGHL